MQSYVITEKSIFPVDDSKNDDTHGHKTKNANKNKLDKFWKKNKINSNTKLKTMSQTVSVDAHRTIDVHNMTQASTSQQESTIVTDEQQLRKCKSLGNMQQKDRVKDWKRSKSNCDFRYLSLNNKTEENAGVENRDCLLHDQDTSSSIVFNNFGVFTPIYRNKQTDAPLYRFLKQQTSLDESSVKSQYTTGNSDDENQSIKNSSDTNISLNYKIAKNDGQNTENQEQIYLCAIHVVIHPTSLEPVILWLNPENHSISDLDSYRYFCFPESRESLINYNSNNIDLNTYQFVRTKENGTKEYGYCRKYMNAKKEMPVVFCLASYIDAFSLYDRILEELGNVYRTQDLEHVHIFLKCLYTKPLHSQCGQIPYLKLNDNRNLILDVTKDEGLLNSNCDILLRYLNIEIIVKVISTLLMEKSVVLFDHKLSSLSKSIKSFRSLLYPFSWPYSYVPVLPSHLITYCDSPSPFLFGLMSDNFNQNLINNTPDVLFVCMRKNKIYNYNQVECDVLPDTLTTPLIKLFKNDGVFHRSLLLLHD